MKVYVIGDDQEHAVRLCNFINSTGGTAILSEDVPSDYGELVDDMLEDKDSDFDLIVAISKHPIEVSIEANKSGKLRAVVCRNQQEAKMARKARTNVIVLDGSGLEEEEAGDIIEAWLGAAEQRSDEEEEAPAAKPARHADEKLKRLFSFANQKPARKKRKPTERDEPEEREEEDDKDEEDEMPPKPKGKGFIKNLKYTFGVE